MSIPEINLQAILDQMAIYQEVSKLEYLEEANDRITAYEKGYEDFLTKGLCISEPFKDAIVSFGKYDNNIILSAPYKDTYIIFSKIEGVYEILIRDEVADKTKKGIIFRGNLTMMNSERTRLILLREGINI